MAAHSATDSDVEAYEQCRSCFSGIAGCPSGRQTLAFGIAVLLREGTMAWLKYRSKDGQMRVSPDISLKHWDAEPPPDELVILLASLIGGSTNESES